MKAMAADANNNTPACDQRKYSLRPRTAHRAGRVSPDLLDARASDAELTAKPAPLSRYRRKTANARERDRMREINAAFETLRRAVPSEEFARGCSEKLTKITTLRLAMRYISELRALLDSHPPVQPQLPMQQPPPLLDVTTAAFPRATMPQLPADFADAAALPDTADLPDLSLSQDLVEHIDLDHLFT